MFCDVEIKLRNMFILDKHVLFQVKRLCHKTSKTRNLTHFCLIYIYIYIRKIISYSGSTLNVYSLFSQKWWIPLIKFMMRAINSVKGGNTHLMYSRNII